MELLSPKIEIVTNKEAAHFFLLFFAFLGIIFLTVALILVHVRRKKVKKCLEKTMAKLIEYRLVRHGSTSQHYSAFYHAVYEYYVNGMKCSQMSRYGLRKLKQDVGKEVLLHYNAENPELFFVEEDMRISKILSTVFLTVGVGIFILVGILIVVL